MARECGLHVTFTVFSVHKYKKKSSQIYFSCVWEHFYFLVPTHTYVHFFFCLRCTNCSLFSSSSTSVCDASFFPFLSSSFSFISFDLYLWGIFSHIHAHPQLDIFLFFFFFSLLSSSTSGWVPCSFILHFLFLSSPFPFFRRKMFLFFMCEALLFWHILTHTYTYTFSFSFLLFLPPGVWSRLVLSFFCSFLFHSPLLQWTFFNGFFNGFSPGRSMVTDTSVGIPPVAHAPPAALSLSVLDRGGRFRDGSSMKKKKNGGNKTAWIGTNRR